MERINDAKQLVLKLHTEFLEKMGKEPVILNIDDPIAVEKAFEKVFNADYKATRLKTSFPRTLGLNLRKAFADLLLLMEGKDVKAIKEIEAEDVDEKETEVEK